MCCVCLLAWVFLVLFWCVGFCVVCAYCLIFFLFCCEGCVFFCGLVVCVLGSLCLLIRFISFLYMLCLCVSCVGVLVANGCVVLCVVCLGCFFGGVFCVGWFVVLLCGCVVFCVWCCCFFFVWGVAGFFSCVFFVLFLLSSVG